MNRINMFSFMNIQGLKPKTKPSKVPYVADLIQSSNKLFIGLSETWLKDHCEAELQIEGYTLFQSDRKRKKLSKRGRDSGGVAFYVRNDIAESTNVIYQFSNGVVEALCLYSKIENLILGAVYRQPDDSVNCHRSLNTHFKEMLNGMKESIISLDIPLPDIIIGGDFNLPKISWSNGVLNTLPACPRVVKEMAASLQEFCCTFFLNQFVEKPTHKDGNILDLVLTNNSDLVHDINVNDTLLSITHHKVVEVSTAYCIKSNCSNPEQKPRLHSNEFQMLNFFNDQINWDNIRSKLRDYSWDTLFRNKSADEMLNIFYAVCLDVAKGEVPRRKHGAKKTSNCSRKKKKLLRRRKQINKTLTKVTSALRIKRLQEELVEVEKKLMALYRSSEEYEEKVAVSSIKKNSKYFFKYAKKFSKIANKIGPLKDEDGELVSDPSKIGEILSKQFVSVFSKPLEDTPSSSSSSNGPQLSEVIFDQSDVEQCIDEIRKNAAPGFDGFPAIFLKICKLELSLPLTLIWSESFKTASVPLLLKKSIIVPIHKGGSKALAKQYRPVALTSHLIKIFEKMIKRRLMCFLEENQLLKEGQHGFRSGRSCLSQLLEHFEMIVDIVSSGKNVDVIYLDFAKAFDKVDFDVLLSKLSRLGVSGRLLLWIKEFLVGRLQSVVVNGTFSDFVKVLSGVPQGSVLGPILFLVMMTDIDDDIVHAVLKSFADDTRVSNSISNLNDMTNLQNDANTIYAWANNNNLEFNDLKFELIQYGADDDLKCSANYLSSSNNPIEPSTSVRDLGVIMQNDCTFSYQVDTAIADAKKRAGWALRTFKSRDPLTMLTLWKSLVLPKLEYCSQLWCPIKKGDILRLEDVQRSFVRKIRFQDSFDMNYWQRLSCLKMYSLQRRRERYRILYVWKIIEGLVPNLSVSTTSSIQVKWNIRVGRQCVYPRVANQTNNRLKKLHDGLLSKHGSLLFNCLPKNIRNMSGCSVVSFKRELDNYLQTIPDEPLIPGYGRGNRTLYGSNSLIDILSVTQNH